METSTLVMMGEGNSCLTDGTDDGRTALNQIISVVSRPPFYYQNMLKHGGMLMRRDQT